ncbi:MAG TPA: AgmX/PglI C-terminal domain-containing protein [Polyangiaceae bacterium]
MANTSAPPPPPKTNNGPFVIAAILMLLLMGGLVVWKLGGKEEDKPPVAVQQVAPTATEAIPDQIIPPPPPPPPSAEPDAGAPSTTKKAAGGSGIGTGCPTCGNCTGEPAPSFSAVLRTRANQAQRCYEKALAQSEQLQGKLTVNLCVGVGGGVCSANISNDTLGSPMVSQCVANIYRATTFPSPKNGCVEAKVPLNFVPQKQ